MANVKKEPKKGKKYIPTNVEGKIRELRPNWPGLIVEGDDGGIISFNNATDELKAKYEEMCVGDFIKVESECLEGKATNHILKLIEYRKAEKQLEQTEAETVETPEVVEKVAEIVSDELVGGVPARVMTDDVVPKGAVTMEEMGKIVDDINKFLKKNLIEDEDYGIIKGTSRPSLLKPGAEKITRYFGSIGIPYIIKEIEDWTKPFFMYRIRMDVVRLRDGAIIAHGYGSCNSYEKKYYERAGSGRYKGDPYFLDNVVLKMAKKRASVDAVMTLPGVSVQFTQDMEDVVKD